MGVMPVRRLVLSMSWPMALSMLIQALYNLVDSLFVVRLSRDGFEALALVYPVQMLMVAVCVGTGVGFNALLARRLGQRRQRDAERVAANGYFVYTMCWLGFLVLGVGFARPFLTLFSNVPQQVEYGAQYLTIVTGLSIGVCMQFAGERTLQATGDMVGPMLIQGIGAVVNLVLDPLLIFGIGPFPRLEVAGAALATVMGQLVGLAAGFFLVKRSKLIRLSFRGFRPDGEIIRAIFKVGFPAILMQALSSVMTVGMNLILPYFTPFGVFILGAYYKIQSFIFMPLYGMTNALVPIISFNFGAKQKGRITGTVRFALTLTVVLMAVGTIFLLTLAGPLLTLFEAEGELMAAGVAALRLIALSFLFAGVSLVLCSVLQALGSANASLAISLLRQVVVLLPAACLLGALAGDLVWLAFLAAETVSCGVGLLLYRRAYHNKIVLLPDEKTGPLL